MKLEENSAEVKREKENLKMVQNAVQTIGGIPTGKFNSISLNSISFNSIPF